jgi:hypothetical protein
MKLKIRVALTNWINVIGIFLISYLFVIVYEIKDFPFILLSALFLLIGYGIVFWFFFIVTIFILDFTLFNQSTKFVYEKLFAEWIIVCTPFLYWIFDNQYPYFKHQIIAFGITQYIRKNKILKILKNDNF